MKIRLFLLLISFSFMSCQSQNKETPQLVTPKDFSEKIKNKDIQLVDVRTPKEYEKGHIKNAQNIHLYDQDFAERINTLDKNKTVYVYCKAGSRSAEAIEIMQTQGFKSIVELDGGTDSWSEDNLPLE